MGKKRAQRGKRNEDGPVSKTYGPGDSDLELEGTGTAENVAADVEMELEAIREMEELPPEEDSGPEDKEFDGEGEPEEEAPQEDGKKPDPYLLADADYIKKDLRWRNKQRTLVFGSRGVGARFRHLLEDIKKLLPHHKAEPKFDKRSKIQDINEICELKSCNNVVYFEARKGRDLYMYLARVPQGPTMKFQVHNIHTTAEVRLAGNCLLGSRPVLYFDLHFAKSAYLRLVKEMLSQAFGTPRNHPKSKPFHDHVMAFYFVDRKIWFRHYQISPEAPAAIDDPEKQQLTEIGPRFVLEPMRITGGSFSGATLFLNSHYMSPTALRVWAKKQKASPFIDRMKKKDERKEWIQDSRQKDDPLEDVFM